MNNVQGIQTTSGSIAGAGSSTTIQISPTDTDISNGYITVPTITLNDSTTKVVRGGAIQDNSMYQLNTPSAEKITFTVAMELGEKIKIFN